MTFGNLHLARCEQQAGWVGANRLDVPAPKESSFHWFSFGRCNEKRFNEKHFENFADLLKSISSELRLSAG